MAVRQPLVLQDSEPGSRALAHASGSRAVMALSLTDALLSEILKGGSESASGMTVSTAAALKNPAFFRAVSLISNAMGMLPMQMIDEATKQKATGHPLYRVLHREPNNWQTAFDFRSLMTLRMLTEGDAFAYIVRSRDIRAGRDKIVRLVPLAPRTVTPLQADDWSVTYRYTPRSGGTRILQPSEIFHLRGLSMDGLNGISLVRQACDAIGTALAAKLAAGRLFKNGAFVGGALSHQGKLGDVAYDRLKQSLEDREGAENAGKTLLLEEGMTWQTFGQNARDAQLVELMSFEVEEISRVTGVPRPLLMMDETAWGTGVGEMGRFFVQYALGPVFAAWEQSSERSLLADDEKDSYAIKVNPGALLRGSLKDQADFFAKAGGGRAWMSQNDIRDLSDMPADPKPTSNELGMGPSAKTTPNPEGALDDQPK